MTEVPAIHNWPDNASLILDVAKLGYLRTDVLTLDLTYGLGGFWTKWRPEYLKTNDINPLKGDTHYDFTDTPYADGYFGQVVFDPPYKLNGTPDPDAYGVDGRYGVEVYTSWQARMELIARGVSEAARITSIGGMLLVKCQDQVCSGKMRWQTDLVRDILNDRFLTKMEQWRKVDRFDLIGHERPQPGDRTQRHARGRGSTLLVFTREK